MEIVSREGRTSIVYRVEKGLVCKLPRSLESKRLMAEFDNAFAVERQILERLGDHRGIVRYYGPYKSEGMKGGLLLGEADCGDLQSYIDRNNSEIDDDSRKKWSLQVAEALAFVHEKGIIHSNLSTSNVLVHQAGDGTDLILADFGGSRCPELGLDGNLLPDNPFIDPRSREYRSPKLDVFGLGVIIYIIMTGHYPFHQGPAPQNEERFTYGNRVRKLFDRGEFPDLSDIPFGDVIAGCCRERRFETGKEVFVALEAESRCCAS